MQTNAAVFRTQETLEEGCRLIDETVASFADVKVWGARLGVCSCLCGGRGFGGGCLLDVWGADVEVRLWFGGVESVAGLILCVKRIRGRT